jgi:hypothetical protein
MTLLKDYLLNRESGDATATEITEFTGLNRSWVARVLNNSEQFVETRKVGKSVYYGVKTNMDKNLNLSLTQ